MEKQSFSEKQTWSTWEELLLAYAVYRYGMESWDSISAELRKQSTTMSSHLTAVNKSTTHSTFWLGLLQARRIPTPVP